MDEGLRGDRYKYLMMGLLILGESQCARTYTGVGVGVE